MLPFITSSYEKDIIHHTVYTFGCYAYGSTAGTQIRLFELRNRDALNA